MKVHFQFKGEKTEVTVELSLPRLQLLTQPKLFKPSSNNLETITDNESNFNNENNLLLIDVEPALAKGTQIIGKVTLIEV